MNWYSSGVSGAKRTTSGGKKVGAAVLARSSCHKGRCRLQSLRCGWLYLARGLLHTGHGESVLWLRITIISRLRRPVLPSVAWGTSRLVRCFKALSRACCKVSASGSLSYLYCRRLKIEALSNICAPLST